MSSRFTERTIRADKQWVKITRDNQKRNYTFAVGREGQYKAHNIRVQPFTVLPNWLEAEDWAKYMMTAFK
jgi:hypothetical protein